MVDIKITGIILFLLVTLFATAFCDDETFTITTYYPSPYGSYNELQLYPHTPATTACNSSQNEGIMYYDSVEHAMKVCSCLNNPACTSWGWEVSGTPRGTIVMWSGTLATIPTGWALCNGTNGTPDLRDKFIYGTSAAEEPGATGGATTHTHTVDIASFASSSNSSSTSTSLGGSPAAATHSHSIDPPSTATSSDSNLPPYYKLAFIMKL
ncbi:MAG: hypothetical protein V1884_01125 [Candidatus Omnitrophota bacterium]